MVIPVYDPKDDYCRTLSYMDIDLEGLSAKVSAVWCVKHNCWIGICAHEWYLKARELAGKLGEGKCRCPNYLSVVDGKCGACGLPVPGPAKGDSPA